MIAIYGPAGVGKSTQAQILADKMGRKWLSAGQIIRDSGEFEKYTAKGAMIDEHVLVKLINDAVVEAEKEGCEVVFDGQPGSPEQIGYWQEVGLLDRVECFVVLRASEDVLIERLSKRGRADDNIDNWKTKISYFEQKIYSFLTEVERQNIPVFEIDGEGEIEEVSRRLDELVRAEVGEF